MAKRAKLSDAIRTAARSPASKSQPVNKSTKAAAAADLPAYKAGNRKRFTETGDKTKVQVAAFFAPEVRRQLKQICAAEDLQVQQAIAEALNLFFQKHGKPPIAE